MLSTRLRAAPRLSSALSASPPPNRAFRPAAITTTIAAAQMSSSAAPAKPEWLVIIPDHPGVLEKRMQVRTKHFEGLTSAPSVKWGGGMLVEHPKPDDEGLKLKGSAVTVEADDRDELMAILKKDIYATSGVWDLDSATVIPFKTGVRKAM